VKIYHSLEEFRKVKNAVVTTGTFDGVHVGHITILERLKEIANSVDGETVLLTFFPHPRMVLFSDNDLKLITSQHEKIDLLRKAGVDHLIIHPFSKVFSRLSSVEFVRDVLVNKIGTSRLVIGYNHHFGRNREGSFEHLKEYGPVYGFQVEEICAQDVDAVSVSSTKIRKALESGDLKTAKVYLGHQFQLSGTVVVGENLGNKIGFPTANIQVLDVHKLIPANGVYAVRVLVREKEYLGMLNIGNRPTVNGVSKTIEVHIINFNASIYGEEITVVFEGWIRNEQKFKNIEALQCQLLKDKQIVLGK
jgi:riboflavin kinase/FMN adenylyltransferase|tara:strand:- start:3629 stop:4546 length:918 start_codon:yes stop_codon:yes gene_type:complete